MMRVLGAAAIIMTSMATLGCGSRVMVPPQIDLKAYEVIGVIEFNCTSNEALGPFAAGRFIEAARQDQGMVRFLRLGTEREVLGAIGQSRLDPVAFKAVGEKYGVKSIVTGELVLSDVRPKVGIFQGLTSIGVSADVHATLAVQMVEAATGASLWSRSAGGTREIGGAGLSSNKTVSFGMDDPERVYGRLVTDLAYAVTPEFRVTWARK